MTLYAARQFKGKDPQNGGYRHYGPGEVVPDEIVPDVKTLVNQGYLVTDDSSFTKRRVARHKGNVPVSHDGKEIPPGKLARFKAERDVGKIKDIKELWALAEKHDIRGEFKNVDAVREALINKRAQWYGERASSSPFPTEEAEVVLPEYEDDLFDRQNWAGMKVNQLKRVAESLSVPHSNVKKSDLVEAIQKAPWTLQALVRLSPGKLASVADSMGVSRNGDEVPQEIMAAIVAKQETSGEQ